LQAVLGDAMTCYIRDNDTGEKYLPCKPIYTPIPPGRFNLSSWLDSRKQLQAQQTLPRQDQDMTAMGSDELILNVSGISQAASLGGASLRARETIERARDQTQHVWLTLLCGSATCSIIIPSCAPPHLS
jgi:hypothetical protein